ncbi:type II toxin-antitoxin system RelE/ParE family toxin [Devosia sp.]|uniref:type II toxin-antitoxin system RelE/ParE family toxin n=1 Tax=Devosia sp. TaxID=1871048 RepID=UPI002635606E|nr:type II toxin-antitoxin system RelE/ParE family toxin [Devosia sp.]
MAYKLTVEASDDLRAIYAYSIETFGDAQAERYQIELDACFKLIAKNPGIGRPVNNKLSRQWRRHPHGSHVVVYEVDGTTVLILAVAHMSNLSKIRQFDP